MSCESEGNTHQGRPGLRIRICRSGGAPVSELWTVLTASALAVALVGWVPRSIRPALTIVAAAVLTLSTAVAVTLLGMHRPLLLVLLGSAGGLGFSIGRPPRRTGCDSPARRLAHRTLAISITATSVGLVCAGAIAGPHFPEFAPPAPSELTPATAQLIDSPCSAVLPMSRPSRRPASGS